MRVFIIILCLVYNGAFAQQSRWDQEEKAKQNQFAEKKVVADQGGPVDQYWVANSYLIGHGVKLNKVEGFKYCQKSANQGYARAQERLSDCYEKGEGVERDLVKSYAYISLALLSFEDDAAMWARKRRGSLAENMTYDQIQSAKQLAVALQAEIVARAKAEKK